MSSKPKYNLYIDECGDHCLAAYDRNIPVFTLCGILVPIKRLNAFQAAVDRLKLEFWNTTDVIYPNIYSSGGKLLGLKIFPDK